MYIATYTRARWNNWKKHEFFIAFFNFFLGYSYTDQNEGYATNQTTVAKHLFLALKQFYKMFPEYTEMEFYIAGESYAGFMLISVFTMFVYVYLRIYLAPCCVICLIL